MRKKENILYDLVRIASRASEDLDDNEKGALIRDDVVEPLYLVARQLKTKGFVKLSQVEDGIVPQQGLSNPGHPDGGAVSALDVADVSPQAMQGVQKSQQAAVDKIALHGPGAKLDVTLRSPVGTDPNIVSQAGEMVRKLLSQKFDGWSVIVEGQGDDKTMM